MIRSEVPQDSSKEDIIGDLMGGEAGCAAKGGVVAQPASLPQKWLRIEHSGGRFACKGAIDEAARKEKTNVAVVCRWPASNGES